MVGQLSFFRGVIFGLSLVTLPYIFIIDGNNFDKVTPNLVIRVEERDTIASSWTAQLWETSASRTSFPFAHIQNITNGPLVLNSPVFLFVNTNADFFDNYILPDFVHLVRILERVYNWITFTPKNPALLWQELLSKSLQVRGRAPDVVLFRESLELMAEFSLFRNSINGAAFFNTQVWVLLDDSHWHGRSEGEASAHRIARSLNLAKADLILATYAYTLPKYYPNLNPSRVMWLPHAASPEFVLSLNPHPRVAAFVAGTLSKWYPLRQQAAALAGHRPDIIVHKHPGDFPAKEGGPLQGQGLYVNFPALRNKAAKILAREFNSHLACIVDGLALWHTVAKVFEISATGCLLILDDGKTARWRRGP